MCQQFKRNLIFQENRAKQYLIKTLFFYQAFNHGHNFKHLMIIVGNVGTLLRCYLLSGCLFPQKNILFTSIKVL